jgi:dihydroneopterin triphosphate diphosphatase
MPENTGRGRPDLPVPGQAAQSTPANGYKRPESVLVLVYTRAGSVLLLERRQPAGYWQSVTGSLEWREPAAAAAVREVREETGLEVASCIVDCRYSSRFEIIPPWRARYAPTDRVNTEHLFRVEYSTRPAVRINLSEHSRFQWLSRSEALQRASSRTNREAIARYVPGE